MFYSMAWDIHEADPESVRMRVVQAVSAAGGKLSTRGHYPGSTGVELPFLFKEGRHIASPQGSLRVFVSAEDSPGSVRVDLDWYIGVVWDPEHGRRNLGILMACADCIYAATAPAYGWCHDHTYVHDELKDLLASGLPVGAQFVYVGPELVNRINRPAMRDLRHVVTPMSDGGIRIENQVPTSVESLDLAP
jgi:hypothetical protein